MADHNRISASITNDDLVAIAAAINTINTKLPFLVSLEPGEIRELPKIGPKTLAFDEGCRDFMQKHPELVPGYIVVPEVDKDRVLREQMSDVVRTLGTLAQNAEDTLAVISHEIYNADLAFYNNVKQAAKRGILNAQSVYEVLSVRFPGRSGVKPAGATAK